ncbi:hypothetical protein EAH87_15090 [Sphingomonas koreensis]|nr:hypothetical protein EAH87_15090 [Sphingomonas koreensis]
MNMSASPTAAPQDASDPAAAFERMRRTLAGQTAAIEGFAARQQELHARDYGPDLAKIHDRMEAFRGAILKLNDRPAMALTPETITSQIEAAGSRVRAQDHQAWTQACREQRQAASDLKAVAASALAARVQRQWIGGAAAGAFVLGVILCAIVPGAVDRSVPGGWHWPEQRAAHVMRMGGWSAGERLMQLANPAQWQALNDAAIFTTRNADALAACRARAVKEKKLVSCTVDVASSPTG